MLWGGELLLRDGAPSGQVTSAAWGETLGAGVPDVGQPHAGAGPVTPDWVRSGDYEVDVGGDRYQVRVTLRPPYDPGNERVR